MKGRRNAVRWAALVAGLGLTAVTLWWTVPLAGGQQSPSKSAGRLLDEPQTCVLAAHQPEEPFEVNTAVQGRGSPGSATQIIKTVAMEKEIYECGSKVVDAETFVDLVAFSFRDRVDRAVFASVQAITCTKDFAAGTVACSARRVPIEQSFEPIKGCTRATVQPQDPVGMNSFELGLNTIDTIKVEKDVLDCGDRVGELFTFTEIIEEPAVQGVGGPGDFQPVANRFEILACFKSRVTSSTEKTGPEVCVRQSAKPQ